MNFIEQLFGFAPDAGNGLIEALLFAVLAVIVVARAASARALVQRRRIGGN
ncbi:hypothetical protein BH18ACI5_BH18ACI5_06680 [soil metagenome]